jgi:hypothetical protein
MDMLRCVRRWQSLRELQTQIIHTRAYTGVNMALEWILETFCTLLCKQPTCDVVVGTPQPQHGSGAIHRLMLDPMLRADWHTQLLRPSRSR